MSGARASEAGRARWLVFGVALVATVDAMFALSPKSAGVVSLPGTAKRVVFLGDSHWVIARAILGGLGATDFGQVPGPEGLLGGDVNAAEVVALVRERQLLLRDAWLSATGHVRPGIRAGVPLEEAATKAAELERRIRALLP